MSRCDRVWRASQKVGEHPLQMCRSNLSTTSLHLGGRVARPLTSHKRARALRSMSTLSVPEAW
eukprot:scaffold32259_cov66-Phaeocystis_antarctica.AAC.1